MPFGKGKGPKAPKPPKEKKPKKLKKGKGAKQGEAQPAEGQEAAAKKKLNPIFLIISLVVIAAAAAIVVFVVLPRFRGEDAPPEPTPTVEPQPPELPEELKVGEELSVVGMALGGDESGAEAVLAKTITYTYINLNDAGKAAETYVGQLSQAEESFSVVDEEFVLTDRPDFTAPEGSVIMARNLPLPKPEETPEEEGGEPEESEPEPGESGEPEESPEPTPTPTPEPVEPPERMVLTVRIKWSEGQCVVTADEEAGMVTSPPRDNVPSGEAVTMRGAVDRLKAMSPAELGLPGESMDAYEVLAVDGVAMVDGAACIRVHVYSEENSAQSSEFMGSFLMSIDGRHLYRVDSITDEVEIIK